MNRSISYLIFSLLGLMGLHAQNMPLTYISSANFAQGGTTIAWETQRGKRGQEKGQYRLTQVDNLAGWSWDGDVASYIQKSGNTHAVYVRDYDGKTLGSATVVPLPESYQQIRGWSWHGTLASYVVVFEGRSKLLIQEFDGQRFGEMVHTVTLSTSDIIKGWSWDGRIATYAAHRGGKTIVYKLPFNGMKFGALENEAPLGADIPLRGLSVRTTRDIQFLAAGDPQVDKTRNNDYDETVKTSMAGLNLLLSTQIYRGLIVAGDITEWTRRDEMWLYESYRTDQFKDLYYEGLGNHDLWVGDCGPAFWSYCSQAIIDDVRRPQRAQCVNLSREPIKLNFQGNLPHYSWDWDDVHFVQLNLYPGEKVKVHHFDGVNARLDPMNSLDFLINDLNEQVGISRRPVVLIHHYPVTTTAGISTGEREWDDDEKLEYWNVIRNYNVIGIISGHFHQPSPIGGAGPWQSTWRPKGASSSDPGVTSFITGSLRYGKFIILSIKGNKLSATISDPKEPFVIPFE